LAKLPQQFTGLSFVDPKPIVGYWLSMTPASIGVLQSNYPDSWFDGTLVPNAHEITEHLFPNVAVTTVESSGLRWHSFSSVPLPPGVNSVDQSTVIVCLVAITALGKPANATFQPVEKKVQLMNRPERKNLPRDLTEDWPPLIRHLSVLGHPMKSEVSERR
jgi:hypothetical protein